jgi:uncharacterized membrane protein YccC
MRANYSVTRQRRWDRISGTLIGCALAVTLIAVLPAPALLLLILLAVGTSHAYGTVKYRITATTASISSLLLLHFSDPLGHAQFVERIVDTLIGGALSWGFSYLLPHWERDDLPRTVKTLLAADTAFAEAALSRQHVYLHYRLARKKTLDAVAQLSGTIRRLADEPHANRRALAALGALLGANYLLAAELSSMPVLVRLRDKDLDRAVAEAAIAATRARVTCILAGAEAGPAEVGAEAGDAAVGAGQDAQPSNAAMLVLGRRLAHIELAARKVARLAARPAVKDI